MTKEEIEKISSLHWSRKRQGDLQQALEAALEIIEDLTEENYELQEDLSQLEQMLRDSN